MKQCLIVLSAACGFLLVYMAGFWIFFATHTVRFSPCFGGPNRMLLITDNGIDRPLYCLFSPILFPLRTIWHHPISFHPHWD